MNDILTYNGKSIQVWLHEENKDFKLPVKSIDINNGYWHVATLEDDSVLFFRFREPKDSIPFFNCTLDYKSILCNVKLHDKEFPNSPIKSISFSVKNEWGNISEVAYFENGETVEFEFYSYEDSIPYRDNFPLSKYEAAKTAYAKVKDAIANYRKEMLALGAEYVDEGDMDYQEEWFKIDDIPDYKWDYF